MKIINLNELKSIQHTNDVPKVQKMAWAIDTEFPHTLTKSASFKDTPESTKFKSIQSAFEYRRSISPYYFQSWKTYTEYDINRNGECQYQTA